MPDISKIFMAFPNSTWDFLITDGQGCYIPAYQRPYSWDSGNVDRLLEDAVHGIQQLITRPEAISFIGTIIAIHDTKYRTVQPVYKPEVAPRVMTIIDGQQRICTFIMANIIFHDELRLLAVKLENKKDEPSQWLLEQCQETIVSLQKTIELDRATGADNYRYYPRIIRAYDDVWSKRANQARYTSPIARLIWEYINFHRAAENRTKKFTYSPKTGDGKPLPLHEPLGSILQYLSREITRICSERHRTYDFPSLIDLLANSEFVDAMWGYELPEKVTAFVNEGSADAGYGTFCDVMRYLILSKYTNDRVAFTIVVTESEDDAFDMFEALNTTGEPLTAFETFRPRVIEEEGLENYDTSPSFAYMATIQEYLDTFKKAEQKQRATSELLVPFALAETGERLPKNA